MNVGHSIALIAVFALGVAALRFMPFLIFSDKRPIPKPILYLGRALPSAVIGMLIIYCVKNVSFVKLPFGLPELIAGGLTTVLHLWKRNTLISILVGTVSYMLLIRFVF